MFFYCILRLGQKGIGINKNKLYIKENVMEDKSYIIAKKVSLITILANIILAIFKLTAGFVGKSSAMVADGIHTLSDVLTTLVALVGIRVASKKADENHPYGHEKYESVFAKLLSIILVATGIFIGYEAIIILISRDFSQPGKIALYAAVASIIVKEWMYRYTLKAAKEIRSISMEADAWHHRSDALSSIGTFVGVLGARLGYPALDPIAGIVVSAMVIKVGVDLYLKSIRELVDESASDEVIERIKNKTMTVEGVESINELKTRVSGSIIFVDIDISVDGTMSVKKGHDIAREVHDVLESDMEDIKHCMVHVEPYEKSI